jgi:Fe-S cluster biogenesis protein NfuA
MADQPIVRLGDPEVRQRLDRLDALLGQLEQIPGPTTETALDAVQCLVEVYGEACARMVARATPGFVESMVDDELLRHLLVLHGLHPDPLERRVAHAIESVQPYVHSHGGNLELAGIDDGVAMVRLSGSCSGCASSAATLEGAVKESVLAAAPELSGVEAVPAATSGAQPQRQTLIPADALLHKPPTPVPHAHPVASA